MQNANESNSRDKAEISNEAGFPASSDGGMSHVRRQIERATLDSADANVPAEYTCPITHLVMRDPVVDIEGNTWERKAIMEWIVENDGKSPKTGNKLSPRNLFPNRALRNLIANLMGDAFVVSNNNNEIMGTKSLEGRTRIRKFLATISESIGKDIKLNGDGICALEYDSLTIVIEVPDTFPSFFIYTKLCDLDSVPTSKTKREIVDHAMRLNYLQQETRGACLSVDPREQELLLSYTDRISEVNDWDFRNILENFIDTALHIHEQLLGYKPLENVQQVSSNDDSQATP